MRVVIIGAGAAGLAAAIFAKRAARKLDVRCLDGAARIGAKILVSGGSRCNVTNRIVTERDFWGGSLRVVRDVLRAFPAERAAAFFESLGVHLHEEEDGKLFPDSNRSRTVLDALLAEAARAGVVIEAGHRVVDVRRNDHEFLVETFRPRRAEASASAEGDATASAAGEASGSSNNRAAAPTRFEADVIVLATGGRSLPKTGSDGFGYELARRLGHGHVDTTPALAPLLLHGDRLAGLSGVSHDAALSLRVDGEITARVEGPLLWTHFGVSGPSALNLSRHWHRARLSGARIEVLLNVCPGQTFESLERWWLEQARARPKAMVSTVLAARVPASVADAWVAVSGIDPDRTLAHLPKSDRRRMLHALLATPLAVVDSRGYSYAEVTSGGIPLDEIDPATMQSRICAGLYLVGEILDVDGRLGGFNFQWAWSSGWVAGRAIARAGGDA